MSSAVYSVKFQCDKCGAVGEIAIPFELSLDAELYRYYAPNGWIAIRFAQPKMSCMVLHYCPECNKAARASLGIDWA